MGGDKSSGKNHRIIVLCVLKEVLAPQTLEFFSGSNSFHYFMPSSITYLLKQYTEGLVKEMVHFNKFQSDLKVNRGKF